MGVAFWILTDAILHIKKLCIGNWFRIRSEGNEMEPDLLGHSVENGSSLFWFLTYEK